MFQAAVFFFIVIWFLIGIYVTIASCYAVLSGQWKRIHEIALPWKTIPQDAEEKKDRLIEITIDIILTLALFFMLCNEGLRNVFIENYIR